MKFVLDHEVGGLERFNINHFCLRPLPPVILVMSARMILAGGDVPMPVTVALYPAEQRLNTTIPGHLGEFVDRSDDKRRGITVNLFVDRVCRYPLKLLPKRVNAREITIII